MRWSIRFKRPIDKGATDMMYCWRITERRKHRRIELNFPALFTTTGCRGFSKMIRNPQFSASTIDLCENGLSLLAQHGIPVGYQMEVVLKIFGINKNGKRKRHKIIYKGTTVYCISVYGAQYRTGIEFCVPVQQIEQNFFELICQSGNLK